MVISKKTTLHVHLAHVFDFVYYDYNVKRPSYTFYGEGAECVTQLTFFHFPSFSPCWPLAFHIFPPPL